VKRVAGSRGRAPDSRRDRAALLSADRRRSDLLARSPDRRGWRFSAVPRWARTCPPPGSNAEASVRQEPQRRARRRL